MGIGEAVMQVKSDGRGNIAGPDQHPVIFSGKILSDKAEMSKIEYLSDCQ